MNITCRIGLHRWSVKSYEFSSRFHPEGTSWTIFYTQCVRCERRRGKGIGPVPSGAEAIAAFARGGR